MINVHYACIHTHIHIYIIVKSIKQIKKFYAIPVSKKKGSLGHAAHTERHQALSGTKGNRKIHGPHAVFMGDAR